MSFWPPDPTTLSRPAYRSLAKVMTAAIENGDLPPGTRLPPQRDLADDLGLSVQTVSRAFDLLSRADLISGQVGRGTFVTGRPKDNGNVPFQRLTKDDSVIDCSILTPVVGTPQREAMSVALAQMAAQVSNDALFSFRPRQAMAAHRSQTRDWLERCGIRTRPDRVITTNGNTTAMALALMSAAAPGDTILCDSLSHHTLVPTARYFGLRVEPVQSDGVAMDPSALSAACGMTQARAVYLMPSGTHPAVEIMDSGRRAAIVEVARRHDLMIIENDAWGPLEPSRPTPISQLAPERSFYFTGLSKCLIPGLRVGWLVAPEDLVTSVTSRSLAIQWMATAVMAEIAAHMISDGTAESLLNWQRQALQKRVRAAQRIFVGHDLRTVPRGLHVWLPLPDGWNDDAFTISARNAGVAVGSGRAFSVEGRPVQGVRICLGAPDESQLKRGLTVLARLASSPSEPGLLSV